MRPADAQQIAEWDTLLQTNPDGGDVLQSKSMARIKETQGWKAEFWIYETSFGEIYATALTRKFFLFGTMAYVTRGPGVANVDQLSEIIAENAHLKGFFAVKMEPPLPLGAMPGSLTKVRNIQPNASTVIVDLEPSEEEIFASFRQRARREIRAADKDGIRVEKVAVTDATMSQMFDLYALTGKRAPFFVRPKDYYTTFWNSWHAAGEGDLYFAYAPDRETPIAGAFVCHMGDKALYKDGGSERTEYRHFSHKLQWEIMKDLKAHGITKYDLHGVPPSERLNDPTHPMAGLAEFKLSFNKEVTEYVGTYDQVLRPRRYTLWEKWGERINQALTHRLHKTTLY